MDQYMVREHSLGTPIIAYQPEGVDSEYGTYVNYTPHPPLDAPLEPTDTSKPAPVIHTPRPPNAWILYRSDKLKAIAAGDEIPGLDGVMAELGVSGTSSSDEVDRDEAEKGPEEESAKAKPKPKKKGKKGVKEPTEGLLSLGRGKTGRGLPQADISKMISMLWKRESASVRGEYERRSEMKKAEVSLRFIPCHSVPPPSFRVGIFGTYASACGVVSRIQVQTGTKGR
jgi:hypothetical protein